jgi:hypothetical protein
VNAEINHGRTGLDVDHCKYCGTLVVTEEPLVGKYIEEIVVPFAGKRFRVDPHDAPPTFGAEGTKPESGKINQRIGGTKCEFKLTIK